MALGDLPWPWRSWAVPSCLAACGANFEVKVNVERSAQGYGVPLSGTCVAPPPDEGARRSGHGGSGDDSGVCSGAAHDEVELAELNHGGRAPNAKSRNALVRRPFNWPIEAEKRAVNVVRAALPARRFW